MATENALSFLRKLGQNPAAPGTFAIAGPHPFLREYVADQLRRSLLRSPGVEYRGFQISGSSYEPAIEELGAGGLFASTTLVFCRVAKARRDAESADDSPGDGEQQGRGNAEADLVRSIETGVVPSSLILLFERDNTPAKIKRAVEASGTSIVCQRPFDNQIPDYVALFARGAGVKIDSAMAQRIVGRCGGDLSDIDNWLAKSALFGEDGAKKLLQEDDSGSTSRLPDLFALSDAIARGDASGAVGILDRSIALGRDPFELLAVEIVPALRRMLLAASALARKRPVAEVFRELGLSPASTMGNRAIESARRLGKDRLEKAYTAACDLDSNFKNGTVRERSQALSSLLLELLSPA